jgi:cytochrome c oxidase subunit 3
MSNIIAHKHAHFFHSSAQQANSAKLGMWLFLVTEVLLFSGLFVGYTVIKTLHPEMWKVASEQLNWQLGSVNTIVLITSSWTVALAVRAAQTNKKGENNGKIVALLAFSILCAFAFMGIKYMEYSHKIHDGLLWGTKYFNHPEAIAHLKEGLKSTFGMSDVALSSPEILTQLKAHAAASSHEGEHLIHHYNSTVVYKDSLMTVEQGHLFFGIYFLLTGLHGIHVIIGGAILCWVMVGANKGRFYEDYYTPVEVGGLYWHLVDLIWIYLFPLLYLV